ncbi:MAG: group I intron-associated PD-(D/E)XK endonuclease [Gaiellaceae bacterium]
MLTPDQKGSIAETAIVAAAARLGLGVFKPLTDGERYDLILDLRPRLVRVQCKWAVLHGDVITIRCHSCRRTSSGQARRLYTPSEIDAFAGYCAELDRAFYLPIERFAHSFVVHLRLAPARNNQRIGIHWASDYEFGATLSSGGAIAQLGER